MTQMEWYYDTIPKSMLKYNDISRPCQYRVDTPPGPRYQRALPVQGPQATQTNAHQDHGLAEALPDREEMDSGRRRRRRGRTPGDVHRHAPAWQAPGGLHPEHGLRRPRG